ncbi:MAG: S9 family peptidase [Mangrovibacterium sp.]
MQKLIKLIIILLAFQVNVYAQKEITINDVQGAKQTFHQKSVRGFHSLNNDENYSRKEGNKIVEYSYKTGKEVRVIFNLDSIKYAPIDHFSSYEFSPNEDKILLASNIEYIYRRTFKANYYIWNTVTKALTPLSIKGKQQAASFSPNGERIAFVRDNNLFVKSLKFNTENQVTTDGEFNKIINGAPDWVYEEEFSMNKAYTWSPDSKFIAYIKFNESAVKTFNMQLFQGKAPYLKENELYPSNYSYKYPKAGEKNSIVSVYSYELKSKANIKCDVGEESDQYIPRLYWTDDAADLLIMRMNRGQDQLDILATNPYTGESRPFIKEQNKRYIADSFLDDFHVLPGNKYFVLTSERSGYSQLYLYNRKGQLVRQLTSGKFDVTQFYGYDAKRELFYYQAAKVNAMQREIYYLSLSGKKSGKLSSDAGTNSATFSNGYSYYINRFTNLNTPLVTTLHNCKGKLIRVLEDNAELKEKLSEYQISTKEFFQFKTENGDTLNGWMIKPKNFDSNKKYPLLMTQYSGPDSQQVLDVFSVNWYNYLAQEGFVVACVDPRGTGARGEDFRKCTYLKLGKLESDDQISAAKYLGSLPFIDKANIAIWGWSYGGFMTLLSLEKGGDVFKAGVAIAPVTHWKFYDSVYTERYMRTPQMNPDGYDDNSPLLHPEGITGRLLLVHGSADDNVHFQNSMEMSEALVQAGIQFDMAVYTNRNHSISGGNTRVHLYTRVTDFLERELQGK